MSNELKLLEAAERLNKARAGTPLDQIYQFPLEGNRLLDYVNVADAYLAAREGEDLVSLRAVCELLIAEGYLKCLVPMSHVKPSHGPCCTCQTCGHEHDECVCSHNDLLQKLKALGISTKEQNT